MSISIKTIAVGADDAAFELKTKIIAYLRSKGITVEDYGVDERDSAVLYPDVRLANSSARDSLRVNRCR